MGASYAQRVVGVTFFGVAFAQAIAVATLSPSARAGSGTLTQIATDPADATVTTKVSGTSACTSTRLEIRPRWKISKTR